jgi:isocitrate dehydrogenase
MLESAQRKAEAIVGADLFLESNQQPTAVAALCEKETAGIFKLVTISNRGTQVWPTGSVYTNLINQYRVRFERQEGKSVEQSDIIALYQRMSQHFKICSVELLNQWGDQKAYSLAQGQ